MKRSVIVAGVILAIHGCLGWVSFSAYADAEPEAWLLPDGYRVAASLDCGREQKTVSPVGPAIALLSGEHYQFKGVPEPWSRVAYHESQVAVLLDQLDPQKEYVLGFAWFDGDEQGRIQSVQWGVEGSEQLETILPPVRAAAFVGDKATHARVHLPLAGAVGDANAVRVVFNKISGPNAVVNAVWLLERTEAAPRKRILLATGDDYAGHVWRSTAPVLAEILRGDSRFEVTVNESPAICGSPLLMHYDAVVMHFKNYAERLPLGKECVDGLRAFVDANKGLVFTHFSCGAFQEHPEFVRIAGRVWNPKLRAHDPHGTFSVRVADAAHPVTAGMQDFEILDELYTCLDGDTPIHVVCDAVSVVDQRAYPMAFIVETAVGRVFHCVLGHDEKSFRAPGAIALYRSATAWAAGCDTTDASPELDAIADQIHAAWQKGEPMPQVSVLRPGIARAEAYAVQKRFVERWAASDPIGGYKAAGVANPGADGPLTAVIPSSGRLHARDGVEILLSENPPRHVETEIGYIFSDEIAAPLDSVDALRPKVKAIVAVVEAPGGATEDNGAVTGEDLIAWNINAKALILGEEHDPETIAPDDISISLVRDGAPVNSAAGNMAAGGQWETLLRTVNNLVRLGYRVEPGHVVTNGALGQIKRAEPGHYTGDFGPLGKIVFQVR